MNVFIYLLTYLGKVSAFVHVTFKLSKKHFHTIHCILHCLFIRFSIWSFSIHQNKECAISLQASHEVWFNQKFVKKTKSSLVPQLIIVCFQNNIHNFFLRFHHVRQVTAINNFLNRWWDTLFNIQLAIKGTDREQTYINILLEGHSSLFWSHIFRFHFFQAQIFGLFGQFILKNHKTAV